MPNEPESLPEEVTVSAMLCARIEEHAEHYMVTLHGVGHPLAFLQPDGDGARFGAFLYCTAYFRNAHSNTHTWRVMLKAADGSRAGEIVKSTAETLPGGDSQYFGGPISFRIARSLHYVSIELDGVERWSVPIDAAKRPIHWPIQQ